MATYTGIEAIRLGTAPRSPCRGKVVRRGPAAPNAMSQVDKEPAEDTGRSRVASWEPSAESCQGEGGVSRC